MGTIHTLKPFRAFSPIRWEGQTAPERDWLIEGVVLRKTVALFSGPGETGKSLLMQQLMTSCATGKPWLGMSVPPVRCFGVFAEDPNDELWRRQEGINRHYGISHGDLEDMEFISIDDMDDPALYRGGGKDNPNGKPTPLWTQTVDRVHEFGAQLLILDNVGAIFEANENYKETVRPFIGLCIRLAREIDGAVILLQHPAQAGETDGSGQSGSRMWRSAVRSQMILGRVPEEDPEDPSNERILRFGKANYSKRKKSMRIEWQDGMFVPCVAADADGRLSPIEWIELKSRIVRRLTTDIRAGSRFSLAKQAHNNVGAIFRKDKDWQRYSWAEIIDACDSMMREGRLIQVELGPVSKREIRIRPADVRYPGEKDAI